MVRRPPEAKLRAFSVKLDDQTIDVVWSTLDVDRVRKALIDHDGYDPRIVVEPNPTTRWKGRQQPCE